MIGPLLFIAYFDRVAPDLNENTVSIKYADDLIMLRPMNNQDDEAALQRSIDRMAICMQSKSLALNSDKCCFCTVSESTVPYIPTSPPKVFNSGISGTDNLTYLGVTIDPKLTWRSNSLQKVAKAKKALGSIRRLVGKKIPLNQMK